MEKQNGGERQVRSGYGGQDALGLYGQIRQIQGWGKKNTLHRIHTLLVVQPNTTGALPNI